MRDMGVLSYQVAARGGGMLEPVEDTIFAVFPQSDQDIESVGNGVSKRGVGSWQGSGLEG